MPRLILHIGMPKTGSSSIQETLFNLGTLGSFNYAKLGVANHGGIITSVFSENPYEWRGHRVAARSPKEVKDFNSRMLLRLEKICESKVSQIISGEDIWHMSEGALEKLKSFFSQYFNSIEVVGYVRPPGSFMVSSFQQLVKNHALKRLRGADHYPRYRDRFEKFDRVFGKENVTLRLFDSKQLAQSDVVIDFCQLLGESITPMNIKRVNESLSLEATAVLFAYHREGPKYAHYRGKGRDNTALVANISGFGTHKLRFTNAFIAPVLEQNHNDIAWVEKRLGYSFADQCSMDDGAISSEDQLLEVAIDQFDALNEYVNVKQEQAEPTPKQLSQWIESLRIGITGRNSNGQAPVYGSQGFFTDEQMILLENDRLPPVVALRELALAFERHGRVEEAISAIKAAIALRPDARGLHNLEKRITSRR